jgi:putative exporter of polyketide antibiotics
VGAIAVLTAAGTGVAVVAGLSFWAARGETALTRDLAYAFWFAAAAMLVAMVVAGTKQVWRRTSFTIPEGWVFSSSAVALTVIGVLVDVAGS